MALLVDKVAIVTGSRRGIGRGIALAFAREGAKVVVSDLDQKECQKVVDEIRHIGSEGLAVKCDVSNARSVKNMFKKTMKKFGRVDILVNNAGIYRAKPFTELTEKEWDLVIDVNLKSVFLCSQEAVKIMMKQGKGKIVNVASIAGQVGFADSSVYCASKGGIINLTREMALELGQHKINVNAIGPGVIETAMTKDMLEDEGTKKGLLSQIPLGRVGRPNDIANVAVFLASDKSDYITGHTIFADGGWLTH